MEKELQGQDGWKDMLTVGNLGSAQKVSCILDVRFELGFTFHPAFGYRILVPFFLVLLVLPSQQCQRRNARST